MTEARDERLRAALRAAFPAVDASGPPRDLWPLLLRRIQTQPAAVSRLEWALLTFATAWVLLFHEHALLLLYHL